MARRFKIKKKEGLNQKIEIDFKELEKIFQKISREDIQKVTEALFQIEIYFKELERIIQEISREDIQKATEILFEAWEKEAVVYVMGCGGSASTATHFACDLAKCTIIPNKKRFKVIALVDNIPLVSAWTNDEGWNSIFAEQLKPWLKKDDILVGFSVHGGSLENNNIPWSKNLNLAMKLAKKRKAKIIGFSGFDGGAMKKMADLCLVVPINYEPLGTPLVESFHVVLHHLICGVILKEMIIKAE